MSDKKQRDVGKLEVGLTVKLDKLNKRLGKEGWFATDKKFIFNFETNSHPYKGIGELSFLARMYRALGGKFPKIPKSNQIAEIKAVEKDFKALLKVSEKWRARAVPEKAKVDKKEKVVKKEKKAKKAKKAKKKRTKKNKKEKK